MFKEPSDADDPVVLDDVGLDDVISVDLFRVLLRDLEEDPGRSAFVGELSSLLDSVKILLLGLDRDRERLPSFRSSS